MKFYTSLFVVAISLGLASYNQAKVPFKGDKFALDLVQQLESEEASKPVEARKNVFVTPYSLGSVLVMLMAGAKGETFDEIYNTLGYVLHRAIFRKLPHFPATFPDSQNSTSQNLQSCQPTT